MRNKNTWLFKLTMMLTVVSLLLVNVNSFAQGKLSKEELDRIDSYNHTPLALQAEKGVSYVDEGFEGGFPPADWSVDNTGPGFIQTTARVYSGTYAMMHNDDATDCFDWIITPAIDLSDALLPALSYMENVNYATWADAHEVYVATQADMSDAVLLNDAMGPEDEWNNVEISLIDYVGETIYIGFYYQGNWASEWYLDQVKVKEVPGENYLLAFNFDYLGSIGAVNEDYTVDINVPFGVSVDTLTAFFELSPGASVKVNGQTQTSGETQNDFTEPVVYSVASVEGLTRDYTVTVIKDDPVDLFTLATAVDEDFYNDTVEIWVPANQDLTSQVVEFTMADAEYTLSVGATELESGVTAIDVSSTVTVTAKSGVFEKDYTVIVHKVNPLMSFNFVSYTDGGESMVFAVPVEGMIDAEEMTISLEVPYGTPVDSLVAVYVVDDYVSAVAFDGVTVESGVTSIDYTDAGDLVLTLDDPVKAAPITFALTVTEGDGSFDNEILSVDIPNLTGDLVWDQFGRKIVGEIMYDSAMTIKPEFTISPLATIEDTTVAFDFTTGPATYVVTSQNGTEASWLLTLTEQAPSMEADVLNFEFFGQDQGWVEDTVIYNMAGLGFDVSTVALTDLQVSFGATISPNQLTPTTMDFTAQPVTFTVTAQDGETVVDYAAYIIPEEEDGPVVNLTAGEYSNVTDSVMVTFTDASAILGFGFGLVHEDILDEIATILDDEEASGEAEAAGELATFEYMYGETGTEFYASTYGLKPGKFYAMGGDAWDNMGALSVDSIVVYKDTMEVSTFEEMEVLDNVIYYYTGSAIVTYAQSFRHQKWVQDETMGMLIDDSGEQVDDTVTIGDEITGLYGKIIDYYGTLEFQPISLTAETAEIVSRGNMVEPMELTFEEFNADVYEYQSMLVKLTDVEFTQADGSNYFTNGTKYELSEVTTGRNATFRTTFYSVDYIGDTIPEGIFNLVGIKNVRDDAPVITARDNDDFVLREGYEFNIDPDAYTFNLVGVMSDSKEFVITNSGVESFEIAEIYIEGDNEFSMAVTEDIEVVAFGSYSFNIDFESKSLGEYTATAIIELVDGMVYEVALAANVAEVTPESMPYFTSFEEFADGVWPEGWATNDWGAFNNAAYAHSGDYSAFIDYSAEAVMISPMIDLSGSLAPLLDFWHFQAFKDNATEEVLITVDGGDTWELLYAVDDAVVAEQEYENVKIPLTDYIGEVIQIAFVHQNEMLGSNNYWMVDDFSVKEEATSPIFTMNYSALPFGAVDGSTEASLIIKNEGTSYFTLNSVTLKSTGTSAFSLSGAPASAIEVYDETVVVDVIFDGTLGAQADTVLVDYTDPREGNMVIEVPASAIGVACSAPMAAAEGVNTAPYAPSWFEYTPTNDALITVSTCGDYADTDIKVYDACDGVVVGANDDMGNCWNPYASEVAFPAKSGVTYKIKFIDTWDPSGFDWTLTVDELPTAPELISVETSAINAQQAQAVLTFADMIELPLSSKSSNGANSQFAIDKLSTLRVIEDIDFNTGASKTFVPDGEDEEEPNGNRVDAKVLTVGTTEAPAAITGLYGVQDDYDWFAVLSSEIGFYFDITLEVEDGVCDMFLVYDNDGWYGWQETATPGENASFSFTQLDRGVDTMFIWVRRGAMAAVAEPGYGYNLKVWSSAPPVFSIYRDNFKIAGPESMAFTYIDKGIELNKEYCYSITQELNTGAESEQSNVICATAQAGAGDICTKALPLEPGLTMAPKSPSWFVYTPSETTAVTISSNIEENGDPGEDTNDTWLFVYANCDDETPLYENDDVVNGEIRTSELKFVANAGESYLINWRRWAPDGEVNAHDAEPFYFVLEEGDLIDGDYVENAIPVTLPLVDFAGTSIGFNNDYTSVSCGDEFMSGNDVCYTFEIPYGGTISGSIEGEYVGMYIIKGIPGSDACVASATGSTGGAFTDAAINPGVYSIIVSTQMPTEATDFVMDLVYTAADKQTVTYNVDMNVQIATGMFNPATDSVDIVGTLNFWEHTMNLTDVDGDGIYTYAAPQEYYVGEKVRYKYRINADWEKAELSNDVNVYREVMVGQNGTVTDDLFDNMELPTFDVTFRVGMARQIELENFDPETSDLKLELSLVSVDVTPRDADGDFVYEFSLADVPYGEMSFVYKLDGTAESVGMRTAMITADTVITVWYNDDNAVNKGDDIASLVEVYPNPSNGKFSVSLGDVAIEDLKIEVIDIDGKVVDYINNVTESVIEIDMTNVSQGVYYLRINDGNTVTSEKIVIQ